MFETPGPLPWISADVLDEQRSLLTASMFARLHENRWVAGEDRLTSPEQVAACVGHSGTIAPRRGVRYCHGLDVGLVNDRTVLTIAHRERREGADVVVVDHQETWQGTKDRPVDLSVVEAFIVESVRKYPGDVLFDPWQSVHLAQRLESRRIRVEAFTFSSASVGHLALTMYRLLRDRLLDLPDDDELTSELSAVVLRESQPGQYRIDHASGAHDDRVISLALVAQSLASTASGILRVQVATGHIPIAPIGQSSARRMRVQDEPGPVPIVKEGAQRPVERLLTFANARKHPNYRP